MQITADFEALCTTETTCEPLNQVLRTVCTVINPNCCGCWNIPNDSA